MSTVTDRARQVLEVFGRTRISELQAGLLAAGELVRLVPQLLERITDLEAQVAALTERSTDRKGIACACLRCGKAFTVYPSQLKAGKTSGKFCSFECFKASRPPKVS